MSISLNEVTYRNENMALTTTGICAQILSCLSTRKNTKYCTDNDCIIVIGQLIRKYSEAQKKEKSENYYESNKVKKHKGKCFKDHVVPVNVITQYLFEMKNVGLNIRNIGKLKNILLKIVIIAKITDIENSKLNENGLFKLMPENGTKNKFITDPWGRYKKVLIYKNIIK